MTTTDLEAARSGQKRQPPFFSQAQARSYRSNVALKAWDRLNQFPGDIEDIAWRIAATESWMPVPPMREPMA